MPGQAAPQEVSGSALLRRSFRKFFPPAVHGEGAYLWDALGKQYLDFSASAAVNFIGHGVSEIISAMTEQARSLSLEKKHLTAPIAEQYANELLDFAGEKFRGGAVYFSCERSEAVGTALKLARRYQVEIGAINRSQIVRCDSVDLRANLEELPSSAIQLKPFLVKPRKLASVSIAGELPRTSNSADSVSTQYVAEIERAIFAAHGQVAAVVVEPITRGYSGLVDERYGYLRKVAQICHDNGILLIANEVTSGIGRTGRNFAVEHSGIEPEIIVAAKGLSSGYAPLGAVIISKRIAETIASGTGSSVRGCTYSSHPISLAAGRAVLEYISERNLVEAADSNKAGTVAALLREKLASLGELSCVREVRGIGLLWAVELADKSRKLNFSTGINLASKVARAAVDRGLLVFAPQESGDDHLLIAPPAVISEYQVSWGCEQLALAIQQASVHA